MSKDIYVVVEQRDGNIAKVGLELIGEASKLAADLGQKVIGVLMGDKIKDKAQGLIEYGADGVVYVENPMLAEYVTEPYAKARSRDQRMRSGNRAVRSTSSERPCPRVASRILPTDRRLHQAGHRRIKADEHDPTEAIIMTRPAFGGTSCDVLCQNQTPAP